MNTMSQRRPAILGRLSRENLLRCSLICLLSAMTSACLAPVSEPRPLLNESEAKAICPYLFISGIDDRLGQFLQSFPENEGMYDRTFEHSADGKQFRVQTKYHFGQHRRVLLVDAGKPPRVVELPEHAHVNRNGETAFSVNNPVVFENLPLYTMRFPDNEIVQCIDFRADYDAEYFCVVQKTSVTIRSTADPETVLANCSMKDPWHLYLLNGYLYVFYRGGALFSGGAHWWPEPLDYEIYRVEKASLVLERSGRIKAPGTWWTRNIQGDMWVLSWDLCPDGKHLLIRKDIGHAWTRYYLYNLEMEKYIGSLGPLEGDFIGFFDPSIFTFTQSPQDQ